jgi:hypothetical protein
MSQEVHPRARWFEPHLSYAIVASFAQKATTELGLFRLTVWSHLALKPGVRHVCLAVQRPLYLSGGSCSVKK